MRAAELVNIRGNSYRMREHRNLMRPESEQPGQGVALLGLGLDVCGDRMCATCIFSATVWAAEPAMARIFT